MGEVRHAAGLLHSLGFFSSADVSHVSVTQSNGERKNLSSRYYRDLRKYFFNMTLTQAAHFPYIIAGILTISIGDVGKYLVVPEMLFSFIKAIADSWVLLVEINR